MPYTVHLSLYSAFVDRRGIILSVDKTLASLITFVHVGRILSAAVSIVLVIGFPIPFSDCSL